MLDDFREWLSDNLRYILLGLAVILILVIAFFAIRLVRGLGSPKRNEPETQAQTESMTEGRPAATENKLVGEAADSALQQLTTQYYTAVAAKDYNTLSAICTSFTEEDKEEVEANSAIEAYNNIKTYSKKGLEENTYIVYAYFDAKVTGIETLIPALRELYVVTNAEGKLVIGDKGSSQELEAYLLQMQADPDVQALKTDVDGLLHTAMQNDADVATYVEAQNSAAQGGTTPGGDGDTDGTDGNGSGAAAIGTMQVTTGINVRAEASAESTQLGALYQGMQVEVLENLESGWSHIRYTVEGTTIEGYCMTQYLTAVQ